MPELTAADVVGTEFGDEAGIEPDHLLGLARPPALAAGAPSGEAGSALQRLKQLGDCRRRPS